MRSATLKATSKPLSLAELALLHTALADQAHEKRLLQEAAKREVARAARVEREFKDAVKDAIPLTPTGRLAPDKLRAHTKIKPYPAQRVRDEQRALDQSMSDEVDIETLLETDAGLSFRQEGIGLEVVRKLRKGHWVLQAQLDMHGLRVDEAREKLVIFLQTCSKREVRCVRIVHGKGLGSVNKEPVLKGKVQKWLAQRDEVLAYAQAGPNDGGSGALLVLLKGPG